MTFNFGGYLFDIEKNNNVLLTKIDANTLIPLIEVVKQFIIFLYDNHIQYVMIYDVKKKNRYKHLLARIYNTSSNYFKKLMSYATFVEDDNHLIIKLY